MFREFVVPIAVASWSPGDMQRLQDLVEARTPLHQMARILGRTESAIRNKAAMHGIALRGLSSARSST